MRYDSTSALRRFSERPDLAGRDAVGDQAEQAARRLIGQPECHLGSAVPGVAQPEAAALGHAGDADPGQVARLVELHDLDEATDRHRADLPVHGVARPDPGGPSVTVPPRQVRDE